VGEVDIKKKKKMRGQWRKREKLKKCGICISYYDTS
jgi:hypothetical protein